MRSEKDCLGLWIRKTWFQFSVTRCNSDYLPWQVSCGVVEQGEIEEGRQEENNRIRIILCPSWLTMKREAALLLNRRCDGGGSLFKKILILMLLLVTWLIIESALCEH